MPEGLTGGFNVARRDEMEMNMRKMVEADVFRLRGIRDGMTLTMSSLELTVEELKEELIRMKSEHKKVRSTGRQTKERLERRTWRINKAFVLLLQEMEELRRRGAGKVKVDVDNAGSCDLERVLAEMRERYEIVIKNNKQEIEKWYQEKVSRWGIPDSFRCMKTKRNTVYFVLIRLFKKDKSSSRTNPHLHDGGGDAPLSDLSPEEELPVSGDHPPGSVHRGEPQMIREH